MSDPTDLMAQMDQVDLATVETSYPILKTGMAAFTIVECTPTKDDEGKWPYYHMKYALAQDYETQPLDGAPARPIASGFPVTEDIYIGTYQDKKDGTTKPFGVDRMARMREAVFGKATAGAKFNPVEMINQSIMLQLKFNPAPVNKKTGEVYGPRTEITGYVRKKS